MEESASNASRAPVPPAQDPLAEFVSEQPAPAPVTVTVRPAPGHPDLAPRVTLSRDNPRRGTPSALDTRGSSFEPVKRARPAFAIPARHGITTFVLGLVCGGLLSVLGLYSMKGKEAAQTEPLPASSGPEPQTSAPVVPAVSETPELDRPTPAVTSEVRDLPVVDKDVPPPPEERPKSRPVREVVTQAAPPERPRRTVFVGALQIDSTPRGAQVFVDRTAVGVTPVLVTDLRAGSHVVRVEAENHLPWSSSVRVVADQRSRVNPALTPSLASRPDGGGSIQNQQSPITSESTIEDRQ